MAQNPEQFRANRETHPKGGPPGGMAASALGSMAGDAAIGKYNTRFSNGLRNMADESLHMAASGAISGGVGRMAYNAMSGRNIGEGVGTAGILGAASGFSAGVWKSALIGAPNMGSSDAITQKRLGVGKKVFNVDSDPVYRSGGVWGWLSGMGALPRGYAGFGRDIIVNETGDRLTDDYLYLHETMHYWQFESEGYGSALNQLAAEQVNASVFDPIYRRAALKLGYIPGTPYDPYKHYGAHEWEANFITRRLQLRVF